MAKYNYEVAGVEEQFEVEDKWLKNLKLIFQILSVPVLLRQMTL